MDKPLLSVCLITYNQVQYITEAIDTILMQKTNFSWQLVIADDYSTDGTREILLEYKKQFPDLIKLILQKNNVGPEHNWLDLMAYPKTKYVIYAEGDDYFTDPKKLQLQVDFLESHQDFSLCFHPVKVIYEGESRPDEVFPNPEQRFRKKVLGLEDLLRSNFIQTNSAMYRWRFIEENIKDVFPKNVSPGDWFLHILHSQVGKVGFIDKVMSVYRKHPGGLWWNSYKDINKIWKKYGVEHLTFFVELLKFYGSNPAYKKIINQHIAEMIDNLIKANGKNGNGLLTKAFHKYPELAEYFVLRQHQRLVVQAAALQRYENNLRQAENERDANNLSLQQARQLLTIREREIKDIKASRFWKARNVVARLIGKKSV